MRFPTRRDVLLSGLMVSLAGTAAACAAQDAGVPAPEAPAPSPPPPPLSATVVEDVASRYSSAEARQWGIDLPGIVTTVDTHSKTIALTFDACGGPHGSLIDDPLLTLLNEEAVPATLFWNKRWIEANPQRAQQIAANPLFQIENHGTLHKPLSVDGRAAYGIPGTANAAELVEEIEDNRRFMREFLGVESNWFRSGTAHYDDVAVRIARDLGVAIAGFAVNGDAGATMSGHAVASALVHSHPGAIVIMHMNQPGHGTADGVRAAIPRLRAAGFSFVTLGPAPA